MYLFKCLWASYRTSSCPESVCVWECKKNYEGLRSLFTNICSKKLSIHFSKKNKCLIWLQLVRTCARYHQEQKKSEERSKKEKEIQLRHIASTIAREVEFFWSNIEQVCVLFCWFTSIYAIVTSPIIYSSHQVVEIKLQFEIYEKRLKSLCIQKAKGMLNCFPPILNCFLVFKAKLNCVAI